MVTTGKTRRLPGIVHKSQNYEKDRELGLGRFRCARRVAVRGYKALDTRHKTPRRLDRLWRLLDRHFGTGAGQIVGNGFEIVVRGRNARNSTSKRGSSLTRRANSPGTVECLFRTRPVVSKIKACAACSPARYAARPASSGQWCAANKSFALSRNSRDLARNAAVCGFTSRCLRRGFRASAACARRYKNRRDRAWRG